MKTRSFTLLELLIVISVLGVLITLLLPSLSKSREATKRAVCASNMRQVSFAMNLFLKGNNLKFPIGLRNTRPYDDLISAYDGRDLTDAEIQSHQFENNQTNKLRHQLYLCPSSVSQYSGGSVRRNYVLNNGQGSWSGPNNYGLTWLRFAAQAAGDQAVNITSVNTPSQMFMLTEVDVISDINNQGSVGHTHTSIGRYLNITNSSHHDKLNLHGNLTMNAAFVDGSLSLQRQAQLSQAKHWDRNQ